MLINQWDQDAPIDQTSETDVRSTARATAEAALDEDFALPDDTRAVLPFLRWAGGKSWLVRKLDEIFGTLQFEQYHEPFLGGGAVFFSCTKSCRSFLSDANSDLIETYASLRDEPDDIIDVLKTFKNDAESYYKIRSLELRSSYERAARFIYLNQTSFNGIYRVNLKGVYNVPFGFRQKQFLDEEGLKAASRKLKRSELSAGDFCNSLDNISAGDLVFIDPPYTVSHNKNGFIKYNESLFSLEDQYRLSDYMKVIMEIGANFILTNAAHHRVAEIFSAAPRCIEVSRASLIGGKMAQRGHVSEFIFTNLDVV